MAVAANLEFIAEERQRLRDQLLQAAREGRLKYNDGALIDVFLLEGKSRATDVELDQLDGDTDE